MKPMAACNVLRLCPNILSEYALGYYGADIYSNRDTKNNFFSDDNLNLKSSQLTECHSFYQTPFV